MTSPKPASRPGTKGRSAPQRTTPAPARPSKAASARARLAAEQARQARRRHRLIMAIVPIAVVLVAVGALVVVRLTGVGSRAPVATGPAESGVISQVTGVPAGVLDQVGTGTIRTPPAPISAPALTADGKPRVLYVGAEYCPYCAAERWAMVVALSRFGTFSGLGQTASSADDVFPSTPTLSFHGSSYTSSTVSFAGVETEDGKGAPLDTLSAADQQTFSTYASPPYVPAGSKGAIPFVDIGGRYLISGASYDAQVLQGKTHAQVAAALSDPSSDIAKAVDGSANVITAAICATTKNAPTAVCTSAGVQAGAKALS